MILCFAVSKSSVSRFEVRVVYLRNSSQPARSEMAVSLHLHMQKQISSA